MAVLPIFGHRDPAAAFAYRRGRPVSVAEFNRDVRLLAQRLPDRPCILNLCSDRYQFAVGFAAALLRGQVSLLPPNYAADVVARLGRAYPGRGGTSCTFSQRLLSESRPLPGEKVKWNPYRDRPPQLPQSRSSSASSMWGRRNS